MAIDVESAAKRLGGAIAFPTIARENRDEMDQAAFLGLHDYLEKTYPLTHRRLQRETVDDFGLLYRWKGRCSAQGAVLFLAHMDVVDVEEAGVWKYPPFQGAVEEGYVWGRGAIDMKGQLISLLEAVETLLEQGYEPSCDVYLAMSHDEEIVTQNGAICTARLLKERGVRMDMVFDEGGMIMDGAPLGVQGTLALVGVCEKGYMDVRLTAKSAGGHSSIPGGPTALSRVCRAVSRLEKRPLPVRMQCAAPLFKALAPHARFPHGLFYRYPYLFSGVLTKLLRRSPFAEALMRTTMAATMAGASNASNVLPVNAWALVNARNAAGESVEAVLSHMRRAIGDDGVEISLLAGNEPTPMADVTKKPYADVCRCIREVFPGMIVAPYPMLGGTDARFYSDVSDNILRFTPFASLIEDRRTMHAAGERLSLQSLGQGIAFYTRLIQYAAQGGS